MIGSKATHPISFCIPHCLCYEITQTMGNAKNAVRVTFGYRALYPFGIHIVPRIPRVLYDNIAWPIWHAGIVGEGHDPPARPLAVVGVGRLAHPH